MKPPRLLIMGVGTFALAFGFVGVWLFFAPPPKEVEVHALIRVQSGRQANWRVGEKSTFAEVIAREIAAPAVLNSALSEPQIFSLKMVREQEVPAQWLAGQLNVDVVDRTTVKISLAGAKPDQQAAIVNAVVNTFVANYTVKERNRNETLLQELQRVHDENAQFIIDQKLTGKNAAELEAGLKEIDRRRQIAKSFAMELEAQKLQMQNPVRLSVVAAPAQ